MKGQVLLFWKHLQQSAPIALPCHQKFGWISHGLVDETVTAASGPEAVVWALLLSVSHIHCPSPKLHTKKNIKKNKGTDLICKAFIIN